jgi:C1A family cysteine protease
VFECSGLQDPSPAQVFEYIKSYGAIATDQEYPQNQGDLESCRFDLVMDGIQIVGSPGYKMNRPDEGQIKELVYNKGPVTVTFNLQTDFFSYRGGIYMAPTYCQTKGIAVHTLVILGFGTENGVDFWWVQNSWGPSWGLGGYAKI